MPRYQPSAPAAIVPTAFTPRVVPDAPPPANIVPMPTGQPSAISHQPSAPAPAKPLGSGLNFGGLKKKTESTKTEYPTFTDPQAGPLAVTVLELTDEVDSLTARLEGAKADLKALATPFFFGLYSGRPGEPASSVSVFTPDRREVLVTFTKALSKKALASADNLAILGDRAGEFFRPGFEITVDGDAIPTDKAQAVLDDLQQVFARHGIDPGQVMTVKELIKPVPEFHSLRHTALDVATNLALNERVPMTVQVKPARGRK